MYDILKGMRVVELSAFIAAPLAGLTLSQLGADVIRVDPPGGGIDYNRWPLSDEGASLYWTGLNKGKRSVALNLKEEDQREVFRRILKSSGDEGGILLTNLTGPDWLTYDALKQVRPDLIMVSLTGHHDGAAAVDYTVNSAVGVPFATGHATPDHPVNNMIPTWDAVAGLTLATAILAADRHRQKTGEGREIRLALSDVAYSLVSTLGLMTEAEVLERDRPALGNHVYGTFGHNLPTKDGRQVMVAAFTGRQWRSLVEVSDTAKAMAEIEAASSLDLSQEGDRYAARDDILVVLSAWSNTKTLREIKGLFDEARVLWGPYQTFRQMVQEDPRASLANPMFQEIDQPGVGRYRTTGSPLTIVGEGRKPVRPASTVGGDTASVLDDLSIRTDK
ncbi:MAG: CoA transferase [Alphaproteobacteria bacterium]